MFKYALYIAENGEMSLIPGWDAVVPYHEERVIKGQCQVKKTIFDGWRLLCVDGDPARANPTATDLVADDTTRVTGGAILTKVAGASMVGTGIEEIQKVMMSIWTNSQE